MLSKIAEKCNDLKNIWQYDYIRDDWWMQEEDFSWGNENLKTYSLLSSLLHYPQTIH